MIGIPMDDMLDHEEYKFCFKCGKPIYVIEANEDEVQGYP